MRTIMPKHMRMEIKDKVTKQVKSVVEKDYFSIGQVRELFREVTERFSMTIIQNSENMLRGILSFKATLHDVPDLHTEGDITLDMYIEPITYTDDWNKLISRMEKRLKTIAIGLPDPEDEIEEQGEVERIAGGGEEASRKPRGYTMSSKQHYLLEQIFKGAGLDHSFIVPFYNHFYELEEREMMKSVSEVNTQMLDDLLTNFASLCNRSEKPSSFREYNDNEKKTIYGWLITYIDENKIVPISPEESSGSAKENQPPIYEGVLMTAEEKMGAR